jgi:DNA-binding beta-propeller fold protein YncE
MEISTMQCRSLVLMGAIAMTAAAHAGDAPPGAGKYRIESRIAASDALWDYASIDAESHRLYVGRIGGVMAVDLDSRKVTAVLVPSELVHGVAPIPGTGVAAGTNGVANSVSFFEGRTGRIVATIPAGKEPDAIIVEPKSGLVIATNEDSRDLTLIDARKYAAVGTIAVGGKPEFLAADGEGLLFNNIEDRSEIAVIDVDQRKVIKRVKLRGCVNPTGLAYDPLDGLLISACQNGVVKFINAKTYTEAGSFKVGKGPDAVIFDSVRRVAFVPSGDSGTLTVFALRSPTDITVQQVLPTQAGTRTGAVDTRTGIVYLPAAKLKPPEKSDSFPSVIDGSFAILVVVPGS